jgi:hypothetical protein
MKNYCIIIPALKGIGGAQLYAFRRAKYLIDNGYNVTYCSMEYDKTYLEFDEKIKIFYNDSLNIPSFNCSRKIIELELKKFEKYCSTNKLIIESFCWLSASWAEIYANKTNAKHIVYSLGEPILDQFRHKYVLDFIMFKYKRNEFIGITDVSLKIILGKHFDKKINNFVNIAFDDNEVPEKTNSNFLNLIDDQIKFVISTVSRLEKPYVSNLIEDVFKIANKNKKKAFALLICGDSLFKEFNVESFIKKYQNNKQKPSNLTLIFPGFIHPLGKDFYQKSSVFVGMGTAAVASISQGCPTICIDPRVNKSIGVFGLETNNFAYTIDGKYSSIEKSISDLYLDNLKLKKASKLGFELFKSDFENNACMSKLDSYINLTSSKQYYDFNKKDFISRFYKTICLINLSLSKKSLFLKIYNFINK